jgi:2-polyprenyl-3-methyl-5-hydroxy-6-metoxy-1,4-benzoquinol methylase
MKPLTADIAALARLKYGDLAAGGWGPRLRSRFGYYTPDDWYEATVCALVTPQTDWLDVGCGRDLFPFNLPAARMLAARCRSLTGIDPSDNIDENTLLHDRAKCMLQDYVTDKRFDLITLRMVAEHITEPAVAIAALRHLLKPGGQVVIYTVYKYAPVSLIASLTPMSVHHAIKAIAWGAEEKDNFPTAYKMNTRSTLRLMFAQVGMTETQFYRLDDTRATSRWRLLNATELLLWRVFNMFGLAYPEHCLLGVYAPCKDTAQKP